MYRIGIDARMLGEEQTGIGKYIARLCEYVPPLMPEARFVVFLREPEFSRFKSPHPNVELRRMNARWYGYREQAVLPFKLLSERLNLVHFPHFNVPIFYPGKFLVTIHDLTPHVFPGPRMRTQWRRMMFRLVFSRALEKSRRIIAVSAYTKNDIIGHFGTSPEKIRVIHEGIDARFREPGSKTESAEFLKNKYDIAKPFVLYVGVWREHKNLVGLIEAYDILLKKYGLDLDLVLCGKEHAAYPQARETWERLGIGKRVKHPGFIPEDELAHFYRAAALTVVPSFAEGFGFTGLESLACATPVAASRTTSLPEVLGDAAAYFDPHDTENMAEVLRHVLTDGKEQETRIEKTRNLIGQYRWDAMAAKTLECYRAILG